MTIKAFLFSILLLHNVLEKMGINMFHVNVYLFSDGLDPNVTAFMSMCICAVMDWTFLREPANVTVRRGDDAVLVCRPPASRPSATVNWFKNNRLLSPASRVNTEPNGDLFFHRYKSH